MSDLMPGRKVVVDGTDEEEVMRKTADHAKRDHNLSTIPPDVAAKARAAIRDVPAGGALLDAEGKPFKLDQGKLG